MPLILNGSTGISASGGSAVIADGAIGTNQLAALAATDAKIAAMAGSKLTGSVPKAALPTGSVLQVVSVVNKTETSTTGTTYVASGLTASITPTSSTSKIFILSHFYARTSAAGVSTAVTLYRNSTDLGTSTYDFCYIYGSNTALEMTTLVSFLDSPATTSSTTYTLYVRRADSAGTAYIGSTAQDNVITLMEIAA